MKQYKLDGGYGIIGNNATYDLLNNILTTEIAKDYREKLKKEDKESYEEYLKFEEIMRKNRIKSLW